jgi:malate dehydrogenase
MTRNATGRDSRRRRLALRGGIAGVKLIDERAGGAAGRALDLRQAGPISGSDVHLEGDTSVSAASGASVIILADPLEPTENEWSGDAGLAFLRRLHRLGCFEHCVLICAGATQRGLMQQSLDELGLPRRRVIGSAPEAMAATARALVALEAKVSANQVSLMIMGRPPDRMVIPWSDSSIGGHAATALLTASQLHLLEVRIRGLWPPGPGALGTAAALFAQAAIGGSRRLLSAFVSLDRDNGTKAPVAAWPVSIGPEGLERVAGPTLTGRDRVVLDEVLG